jgi:hypothetical protein
MLVRIASGKTPKAILSLLEFVSKLKILVIVLISEDVISITSK